MTKFRYWSVFGYSNKSSKVEDPPESGGSDVSLSPNFQPNQPVFIIQTSHHNQSQHTKLTPALPQTSDSLKHYETFLKGKSVALGIIMIATAISQVALGIGLAFTVDSLCLYLGIPFWGAFIYIGTGSFFISALSKADFDLIRRSMSWLTISASISHSGAALAVIDIIILYPGRPCNISQCTAAVTLISSLLATYILLFIVSLTIDSFATRSLKDGLVMLQSRPTVNEDDKMLMEKIKTYLYPPNKVSGGIQGYGSASF